MPAKDRGFQRARDHPVASLSHLGRVEALAFRRQLQQQACAGNGSRWFVVRTCHSGALPQFGAVAVGRAGPVGFQPTGRGKKPSASADGAFTPENEIGVPPFEIGLFA
jgi:hypothetical protein